MTIKVPIATVFELDLIIEVLYHIQMFLFKTNQVPLP